MTKDEIVERLKNLKKIDKATIILQRKLKELDNNYPHTSGSFEQKVSSSKVNTTEKKLINTLKKKDDIIDQIATLTEEKFATTDLINKLEEPEEWLALRMLYLHGYAVAEVCKEMKVSKATLYRARDRTIEHLEAEVNNSYDRLGFEWVCTVVSVVVNTLQKTEEKVIIRVDIEIRSLRNMKNKIIAVYKIANRLVSITVEEPDFSNLKMNQFVEIGGKKYKVHSIPFVRTTPPKSILEQDTFAIDYTEDELLGKRVIIR